ncbi:hypothetical protein [Virgibacillus salexigens]|uniref:hypothetical protein n=1 Tax=Virgibacillus salexigens TaxID=61016 RepID=UPI00190950F9|nr:hypothetical protein [Virgibacillus salexigens]
MIRKLTGWIKELFTTKEEPTEHDVTPKAIKRMHQLNDELKHLIISYDSNLQGLQEAYNNNLVLYNQQYQKYKELFTRYQNKAGVTDEQLKEVYKLLKENEEVLRNSGYELKKVEQYREEDIFVLVSEMNDISKEYIKGLLKVINHNADELKQLKKQYLLKLMDMGAAYSHAINTEKTVKKSLETVESKYIFELIATLGIHTESINMMEFEIDSESITQALKGTTDN